MSSKKPLFVFFGTPLFSVHALNALESHGLIPAIVVTAPDRARGRGLEVTPSPVKAWAMERGIEVLQPQTLKDADFIDELANTDWDVFIVAAYAKLIPKHILDIPRRGSLNIHPSLLPKFRGPSPAISAILENERSTGVSIMQMSERMDAGPVIAQARIELDETDWPPKGSLFEEMLSTEGGNLLSEILPQWLDGSMQPEVQDESLATFTRKFEDADALVDLYGDPYTELLKVRAFDKGPRAHFFATKGDKRIRVIITEADIIDGLLTPLSVIPEGKREMSYEEFLRSGATPLPQ